MPDDCFTLSLREIATLLGISQRTIRRWSKSGKFPRPVRLGPKLLRWDKAKFKSWCKEQRTPEPEQCPPP